MAWHHDSGRPPVSRRWQRSLFPWLAEFGFLQVDGDACVFECSKTMTTPSGPRTERLLLGVYVDDLAVVYNTDDEHSLYRSFTDTLVQDWNESRRRR